MDTYEKLEKVKEKFPLPNYREVLKQLFGIGKIFSPSTSFILLAIILYFDEHGEAMDADEMTMCSALEINYRTVRRAIKTLKDEKIIEVSRSGKYRRIKPNFAYCMENLSETLSNTWKILRGEKKIKNIFACDPVALKVVEYWNSKPGLRPVSIPLKFEEGVYDSIPQFEQLIKKICVVMSGKFFNGMSTLRYYHGKQWSLDEIKNSIDNFHLAATDSNYLPYDKSKRQKIKLAEFIYSPFLWGNKSPLIEYEEKPKLADIKVEEPKSLPMYLSLKQEFEQSYEAGKGLDVVKDMKVKAASNRLVEWIADKKMWLPSMPMSSMWAAYVVEAITHLIQTRGQSQYDQYGTINQVWFWDFFTRFIKQKGLLSGYQIKK